ncbi:MAG: glycosyltransferase [Pseudomonadota bacterium]
MATVLHVCETAKGGPATYLNIIAQAVGRRNNAIVLPESHASYVDADLRQYRYSHERRGLFPMAKMVASTMRAIREEAPDILFFHSTFAFVAILFLRLMRVRQPMLYCSHGWAAHRYAEGSWKRRMVTMIEGQLTRLPDLCICVSKFDHAFAEKHGYRGQFILAENAVVERRKDARSDLFVRYNETGVQTNLLFVGRFDRQKGLDLLLKAAERLAQTRPDIELHVVGAAVLDAPELREDLPNVTFHGWVARSRIDDWYASADALVLPSRWEGLPLVVPEAYRNETPVIVSTRNGMADLVREGKTGYTFDPNPENLADLLEVVTADELMSMRPAARALYVKRFAAQRLCDQISEIYARFIPAAQATKAEKRHPVPADEAA